MLTKNVDQKIGKIITNFIENDATYAKILQKFYSIETWPYICTMYTTPYLSLHKSTSLSAEELRMPFERL